MESDGTPFSLYPLIQAQRHLSESEYQVKYRDGCTHNCTDKRKKPGGGTFGPMQRWGPRVIAEPVNFCFPRRRQDSGLPDGQIEHMEDCIAQHRGVEASELLLNNLNQKLVNGNN